MRVWDIPVGMLCNKHLLAQHMEVHTIFNVITLGKKGYSHHPETLRWVHWLDELALVHSQTAVEMGRRHFNHKSPIDYKETAYRTNFGVVDPVWRQIEELRRKYCECDITAIYQWYDLIGRELTHERDMDIKEI